MKSSSCPYPGLRPFSAKDQDLFFGREEQVETLLNKLEKKRFVVITGPSGSGKSSLVRAGLIPALEMGFLLSAGENWKTTTLFPGESPINNLAQSLSEMIHPEKTINQENNAFVTAFLKRGPFGIVELVKKSNLPENTQFLIVIDQFEEIFRFHKLKNIENATAFVNLLLTAIQHPNIYVCLTMRSDYIGNCALFMDLPEAMNDSQFLTPRLTRDQRRAIIVGPASMHGGDIEPILVNELLNDMGDDPDQLPLFQHALMRMWTLCKTTPIQLTFENYQELGGIQNILSNHADSVYNSLNSEQKKIAEILFKTLVETLSDKPDIRRPAQIKETAEIAGVDWKEVLSVIDQFRSSDCCFLMPSPEISLNEDSVIDITHESLIRQWQKLKKWTQDEKNAAQTYIRLEEKACDWKVKNTELIHGRDLNNALDWKKNQCKGSEWARRYGTCFSDVKDYLDKSEEKQKQTQDNLLFLTTFIFDQWKKAEEAQNIAEKQKKLALDAINTITYELVDQLKDISGNSSILTGILETNIELLNSIYELSPDDIASLREKGSNLSRIGELWTLLGKTEKALESYEMDLEISKIIVDLDSTNAQAQRDLSVSYDNIGNIYKELTQYEKALSYYKNGLKLSKTIAELDTTCIQAQRDLSISCNKIGDVHQLLGRNKKAHSSYKVGLKIREKIAKSDVTNIQAQRDLSVSYDKVGNVYLICGHIEEALSSYMKGLEISKIIAEADITSTQAQRDLSVSYENIGDVYQRIGQTKDALSFYEKGLEISKIIAETDAPSVKAQKDLYVSHDNIGDVYQTLGKTEEALNSYKMGLEIFKKIAESDATNLNKQLDLSQSFNKIGRVYEKMNDVLSAKEAINNALEITKNLFDKDCNNSSIKQLINEFNGVIARLNGDQQMNKNNPKDALKYYNEALELSKTVVSAQQNCNINVLYDIQVNYRKIGEANEMIGKKKEALKAWQNSLDIITNLSHDNINQLLHNERLLLNKLIVKLDNQMGLVTTQKNTG